MAVAVGVRVTAEAVEERACEDALAGLLVLGGEQPVRSISVWRTVYQFCGSAPGPNYWPYSVWGIGLRKLDAGPSVRIMGRSIDTWRECLIAGWGAPIGIETFGPSLSRAQLQASAKRR